MSQMKEARTVGGPADGYDWEYLDNGSDSASFKGAVYTRTRETVEGKEVWNYNVALSELAEDAADLRTMIEAKKRQPNGGSEDQALVRPTGDQSQWELVVAGEVLARCPAAQIKGPFDALQWANTHLPQGKQIDPNSLIEKKTK